MKRTKEFKVNNYITLKLEENKTNLYIRNKEFLQCKYLLLNFPIIEAKSVNEINSVDEVSERMENQRIEETGYVPPEIEFWGHCSNLQVWNENNYNSRLLHRTIAFPLLNELTRIGDSLAKRILKEEIAKRFASNHFQTMEFLLNEGYLDILNAEELKIVIENSNLNSQTFDSIKKYIASNMLSELKKIELLLYAKIYRIKIKKVGKETVEGFFSFIDNLHELNFLFKNKSILINFVIPFIKKVHKGEQHIKDQFLKEINLRINKPKMFDVDVLNKIKEIYSSGYKNQTQLNQF